MFISKIVVRKICRNKNGPTMRIGHVVRTFFHGRIL